MSQRVHATTKSVRGLERVDAKYQVKIGNVLAEVCSAFEAGKIDGIYIITCELEGGKPTLNYRRAAIRDMDVSWAAVATLLAQHLEKH